MMWSWVVDGLNELEDWWIGRLGDYRLRIFCQCELLQRLPSQPKDRPFVHCGRPHPLVERDRRLVPVEHRPLEASPTPLNRYTREVFEHVAADAESARARAHVNIFEVHTGSAEKRRERRKEQRVPNRLVIFAGDNRLDDRMLAEECHVHVVFGGDDVIRELLVD